MTTRRIVVMATAAVAVSGAVGVLTSGVAVAASCRVVIVQNDPPVGLALSPKHTDVDYGGCVQFSDNAVGPPVTIKVQGGYTVTLDYGASTGSHNSYQATASGTHTITADNGTGSARGSITVGASPSPSASPASTSSSPAPRPRPTASSSSSRPQVAPTPSASRSSSNPVPFRTPSAGPVPSAGSTVPQPGVTPTVVAPPTPTSSPSPVAVAAGPIQPPTGRDVGLPAALAAIALVGVATALLRVLLAHAPAVDGRRTVGESA